MKVSVTAVILVLSLCVFSQEKTKSQKMVIKKEQGIESKPIHKSEGNLQIKKRKTPMAASRKPEQKVALEPKKEKLEKK